MDEIEEAFHPAGAERKVRSPGLRESAYRKAVEFVFSGIFTSEFFWLVPSATVREWEESSRQSPSTTNL
jgi:hypothetical protein